MKSGSTNKDNRFGQSSQTSNPGTKGGAFVQQAEGKWYQEPLGAHVLPPLVGIVRA